MRRKWVARHRCPEHATFLATTLYPGQLPVQWRCGVTSPSASVTSTGCGSPEWGRISYRWNILRIGSSRLSSPAFFPRSPFISLLDRFYRPYIFFFFFFPSFLFLLTRIIAISAFTDHPRESNDWFPSVNKYFASVSGHNNRANSFSLWFLRFLALRAGENLWSGWSRAVQREVRVCAFIGNKNT